MAVNTFASRCSGPQQVKDGCGCSKQQGQTLALYKGPLFVIHGPLREALPSSTLMVRAANEAPDSEQEAVEDVNAECSFMQPPLERSHRKYEAYDVRLSDTFLAEKPINCNSDSSRQFDGRTRQLAM